MDFERQIDRAFELVQQGEPETARTICLELKSEFGVTANLAFLLGAIDFKLADLSSAQTHLEQAVQRDPDNSQYSKVLGNVVLRRGRMLRDLGRNDEARDLLGRYCQSIDHVSFEVTRAAWILPVMPGSQTEMTDARLRYEAAVEGLATRTGVIDEDRLLGAGTNFMAAYQAVDDHRFQEIIAGFYRRNCPALSYVAPHVGEVSPHPETKIRIGFVSVNFNNHTVGKLYRGIIAKLDRTKFEVSVFGAGDDEISHFIQNNCDAYFNLPENCPRPET